MTARRERVPPPRSETLRQALLEALAAGPRTAHDLSRALRVRERDVVAHLEHLARSLRHGPQRLDMDPASCRGCGFVFRGRQRFSRPSACPRCRGQYLAAPVFRLVPA